MHINQLCDPMEPGGSNRTTGVVRMAIEEFWNDLKRAHWVDHATRAMTITVPFSANNAGVRSRVTFMFEFVSAGSVLPSYDVQTRVTRLASVEKTFSFNWIAFVFTIFFCALEVFEICVNGIGGYFNDMWNVMDWLNYSIFFIVWGTLLKYRAQLDDVPCMQLCQEARDRGLASPRLPNPHPNLNTHLPPLRRLLLTPLPSPSIDIPCLAFH